MSTQPCYVEGCNMSFNGRDEEDAKAKQEEDALLIKSIERDRKFLQQSLKYQQTKVAFMNQHGAPDNCPDLLAKKEELVKQKEFISWLIK